MYTVAPILHATVFPLVIYSFAVVAERAGALFGKATSKSAEKEIALADVKNTLKLPVSPTTLVPGRLT